MGISFARGIHFLQDGILFLLMLAVVLVSCQGQSQHTPHLAALRVENIAKSLLLADDRPDHILQVAPTVNVQIRLIGSFMDQVAAVMFTTSTEQCVRVADLSARTHFPLHSLDMLTVNVKFPAVERTYYVCVKPTRNGKGRFLRDVNNETMSIVNIANETIPEDSAHEEIVPDFVHQGSESYKAIAVAFHRTKFIMPAPVQICLVICLLLLSGLFSGLNLGLMSLDKTELRVIMKAGSKKEKKYAKKILPVRVSGNYLLCSILYGNVIVNSGIAILFDDLTSGLVALFVSSFGIVIFGEILPQSICSRYGLAVGANTIYVTRLFMFITAPLSWPTAKILDCMFGAEVPTLYSRDRLLELIRLSTESETEFGRSPEVAIVAGALEFGQKTVKDIMTHIQDVFMIPHSSILDTKLVSAIVESGYTRIPVYDMTRDNIVSILNVKDLALLDPDDNIPVKTVCQFYKNEVRFVLEDTPLNVMLEEFKKGEYHMAFVNRINMEGEGDPFYELIGLVSLEDVIEEILQSEILDETDVVTDNRRRQLSISTFMRDISGDTVRYNVSPTLGYACFQYLSTALSPFNPQAISPNVLQRLIKQNTVETKFREGSLVQIPALAAPDAFQSGGAAGGQYLYQFGRPADYFIMILEGRVSVEMGVEHFVFEAGPFFYFGKQVLEQMRQTAPRLSIRGGSTPGELQHLQASNLNVCNAKADDLSAPGRVTFSPDFTVRITQDVVYLLIKTSTYLKAYRATLIEQRLKLSKACAANVQTEEPFPVGPSGSVNHAAETDQSQPEIRCEGDQSPSSSSVASAKPIGLVKPNNQNHPISANDEQFLTLPEPLAACKRSSSAPSAPVMVANQEDGIENYHHPPEQLRRRQPFEASEPLLTDEELLFDASAFAHPPGHVDTCFHDIEQGEQEQMENQASYHRRESELTEGGQGPFEPRRDSEFLSPSPAVLTRSNSESVLEADELHEMHKMVLEKRLRLVNKQLDS